MSERVWYDIEDLPSGGVSYPKNWKVSITPYSFGDILNLARAAETGIGALRKILDGVKCNFNKDLFLPADIIYLGIYRKLVSTKHSKIEFSVECPVCAKKNKKVMDLKELKFKEIPFKKLPIIATMDDGEELHFEPINIAKYAEVSKKYNEDSSWLLAYSVTNKTPEEARTIILNSVGIDKEVLDEVTKILDFGLKPIEFECDDEYCDNILSVQLDDPTVVVFPFRGSDESVASRIKFGNESSSKRSGAAES